MAGPTLRPFPAPRPRRLRRALTLLLLVLTVVALHLWLTGELSRRLGAAGSAAEPQRLQALYMRQLQP
ncbi:hypothetical protein OOT46_04225, partial [Aquabacterium sp. A7-Y]|uniref:hypothetical protein n=1 Tax=Aquabacterium sp. A7-Y TaxID=1349605 RepID=UPI00223D1627